LEVDGENRRQDAGATKEKLKLREIARRERSAIAMSP
jgi:hypothetical protein